MKPNKNTTDFGPKDRALISKALGELAARLGHGRLYIQTINVMKKWDDLPKGIIQLPKNIK